MNIIFEGPDGSGKSTAARSYVKAVKHKPSLALSGLDHRKTIGPVHCSNIPGAGNPWLYNHYSGMLNNHITGQEVVYDRNWISEAVYGFLFRGLPGITQSQFNYLHETQLNNQKSVIVYCDPGIDAVRDAVAMDEHESATVKQNIKSVYYGYRLLLSNNTVKSAEAKEMLEVYGKKSAAQGLRLLKETINPSANVFVYDWTQQSIEAFSDSAGLSLVNG